MRSEILKAHLKNYFGFDSFKGSQEEVVQSILNGKDTFVLMPTGGGKSLCYQLPALIQDGTAIIISPLIALMKNQVDAIRAFGSDDGVAHFINSSLSKTALNKVKEDIRGGKTKLLYVAPESLTKEDNIEFFKGVKISFYAIDEAHCISEWGHDFRPEYRRIKPIVNEICAAPIIALTATATPKVQHDIQKNLGMSNAVVFKSSFNRPNLFYDIRPKVKVEEQIIKFIKERPGVSGIVYCLSRKKVEELAEMLQVNGINALAYHAGMDTATRSSHQDKFLMEDVDVIVATIAFGMGIDKPDVRFVIHHDVPKSLEGYYQETGRAGRDGGVGHCVTFYRYQDIQKLEKFMHGKPVAEQEIGQQLLADTVAYIESSLCRRTVLLYYFGEKFGQDSCGSCDNCMTPKEMVEGKEMIQTALNVIVETNEQYKGNHLVDILTGVNSAAVKSFNNASLSMFGAGKDIDSKMWNAIYRQCIIGGFIKKEIVNYGVLKMTPLGFKYLETPTSFKVIKNHDYEEQIGSSGEKSVSPSAGDTVLYKMLKDLCKREAKKLGLPPYVIFQDPSLIDMSIQFPVTMEEIQNVVGVGRGKAARYGKVFIKTIAQYVEDNSISRPQDLIVRSVVNKSQNKVSIIQHIDRQVDLESLASSKGLEFSDLITEMEAIVNAGTKVNIDYYLNSIMDEDQIDDVFCYFKEDSEDGDLQAAYDEFEDEFSESEIRLIRLKFLSEMGN